MATITATVSIISHTPPVAQIAWYGFTGSGDVGNMVSYPSAADKTVQFLPSSGSWGNSLTAVLLGSQINSTGVANILKDPTGASISTSSLQTFVIMENPRFIAPHVTYSGSGTGLALDVIITAVAQR